MNYFSRDWVIGDVTEEDSEAVIAAYECHVASLLSHLPLPIRELAESINLHDSLFRKVVLDHRTATLRLELRCGDNQIGYSDVNLVYYGVHLSPEENVLLANLARNPETEVLYDEVDLGKPGWYLHRILFWPSYDELAFSFQKLELELERRLCLNRDLPCSTDRYCELGRPDV